MERINLDHHPDCVSVIDGRRDLKAAMLQARQKILEPANQAVVIVGPKASLCETYRRAALQFKFHESFVPLPEAQIFAKADRGGGVNTMIGEANFLQMYGQDFGIVLSASVLAFPRLEYWDLQTEYHADDTQRHLDPGTLTRVHRLLSRDAHLDSYRPKRPKMPGGLTLTFSVKGGGSVIYPAAANELEYIYDKAQTTSRWSLKNQSAETPMGWQVEDGDVCVLRADNWPRTHLPAIHAAPRKNSDDPSVHMRAIGRAHTRGHPKIVSRSWIAGLLFD